MSPPDRENDRDRFPPNNPWYWFHNGTPIPAEKIPAAIGYAPSDPSWEQLAHIEGLLAQAIEWYEDLMRRGADALPAHRTQYDRPGEMGNVHVSLASSYDRIRDLKGSVAAYRTALRRRRVPRQGTLIAPSREGGNGE